jgi:hypothetical protein
MDFIYIKACSNAWSKGLLVAILGISPVHSAGTPISCTQEYALCTSAPCVPDPRHPDYAICSCIVENGLSLGYSSCEKRVPKTGKNNVKQLTSTFSFAQYDTKKGMQCSEGNPWTNCLDEPCTVNPMNPKQAFCSCKIVYKQPFFTLGGNCDANTCKTGYWSGAAVSDSMVLPNTLFKLLKISKNPWPDSACPGNP